MNNSFSEYNGRLETAEEQRVSEHEVTNENYLN